MKSSIEFNSRRTLLECERLDQLDPLAGYRNRFVDANPNEIYLDGNSLGRMPKEAHDRIVSVAEQWGSQLIRGWADGWLNLPTLLGDKVGQIIGASSGQVAVTDSTTVNLYKSVCAAISLRPGRTQIVTDVGNFPSDLYLLQGITSREGLEVITVPSSDGIHVDPDQIISNLCRHTSVLTLSHTQFKSGFTHNMELLTHAAHKVGALVVWDLSHSAGVWPIHLDQYGVDFAVGCTYKYLNGGPGAPAYIYVNRALQDEAFSPIWGWFGQKQPFEFGQVYEPAAGINRFLAGTPPVLSMAAMEPGLDLVVEAGIEEIRAKSIAQTEFLIYLWESYLASLGVTLNSPRDAASRGSHVSFGHPEAYRIDQSLIQEMNVIPDFRTPDNIRFGASPLYNSYCELEEAVLAMKVVIQEKRFEKYSSARGGVT